MREKQSKPPVSAVHLRGDVCPPAVRALLTLFARHGEGAYPVGGCIRDLLMRKTPHDWDVAVTTVPADTVAVCASAGLETVPTGMAHGTVTVLIPADFSPDGNGECATEPDDSAKRISAERVPVECIPVECTTCRTEGGYADGRHPDAVSFTGRLEDDLSRRDFTVNAMAAMLNGDGTDFAVIDRFGGLSDLRGGVIRCVGDPETRLTEDALRILRAVRFAVRFGFSIEPATQDALVRCAAGLARISRERVRTEWEGILSAADADRGVRLLQSLGLMPYILPDGVSPLADEIIARNGLSALNGFSTRLSVLLCGLDPAAQAGNLRSLRLSRDTEREIRAVLAAVDRPLDEITPRFARILRHDYGDCTAAALDVRLTLIPPTDTSARTDLETLRAYVAASEAAGDCVTIGGLALNGVDLKELGVPAGRETGRVLSSLLAVVLDDPAANTTDRLTACVKAM